MNEWGILISILLIGGGLVTYLGIQVGSDLPRDASNITWLVAVGLLHVISGLLINQLKTVYTRFHHLIGKIADWLGVFRWQILLLALSPWFIVFSSIAAGFSPRMHNPYISIGAWITGILLIILGSYKWGEEKPVLSRKNIFFVASITYIAFLLRGIGTGHFPIILTGDEGSSGISAVKFVNGEWNNIFIVSWFSFPSFFSFIQSLSIRVLGQTTEALRILSAIAGALTVAATYLCGKAMFDERTGRLAALFITVLHFHIHFSRLGLNNIWDGLGFTVTLGALWYAWEKNKRFAYLIAGLALGLSQYFYVSSRGLLAIVIACMTLAFLFQRKKFSQSMSGILIMLAIAVAVIFPLARYYIYEPNQFLAPFERVSTMSSNFDTSAKAITQQISIGLQAYTFAPLRNWYRPEAPILRPILSTFFYIGIIFLLINKRDSRLILITFWLILFGLIGGLSESPPAAQRYVAAAPACALIVGFGLSKITETFENIWAKHTKAINVIAYTIVIIAIVSDLNFYFIEYFGINVIENTNSDGMIAQQLANHLEDEPPGTQVVFLHHPRMGYYSIPSISYLAPHINGIDAPADWALFDQKQLNSQKIIFVFLAEDDELSKLIQRDFPNGLFTSKNAWNGEVLFWLYEYETD